MRDAWYNPFSSEETIEFLTFATDKTAMNGKIIERISQDTIFAVHIGLGNKRNVSSRQVYDLAVYFGDVGGTYGSLLLISSFIASFFNEKLGLIKKAQTFYKVSQDDPFFTGEKKKEN